MGEKFATIEIYEVLMRSNRYRLGASSATAIQVDVIALYRVKPHTDAEMYPINLHAKRPTLASVGAEVFVLGYPFGIGPCGLPIWKRGSIASEPDILSPDQLYIFIDTASRPGMSGSPVIRRSWGSHSYENGAVATGPGAETKFVGIYSGRLASSDPLDAQLGLAWPAALVTADCFGKKLDA